MAKIPLAAYRPKEYSTMDGEYIPEAERLLGKNCRPYIYDFHMQKACSATAVEFITNTTALTTQTAGTFKTIAVVSTKTDDKSAADACVRTISFWGIDSAHNYRIVSTNMSGTTSASAANDIYEFNTMYSSLFGTSTQNAKGSCLAAMAGKVSQACLTIKAGENHSRCARIWGPKGWRAKILRLHGFFQTAVKESGTAAIFPNYYDANAGAQYDGSHEQVGFGREGAIFSSDYFPTIYGNDTTNWKLTFYGLSPSGAETLGIVVRVMLWANPTTLASGQIKKIEGI